jgi:cold shock CspA family protein
MIDGTVAGFDEAVGIGTIVTADGREFLFHCVEIADGSRAVEAGRAVRFQPLPRFGRFQASRIVKV